MKLIHSQKALVERLLIVVLIFSGLLVYAIAGSGDVSGDGYITVGDANMVRNYLIGKINLNADQLARADINNDQIVDVADVVNILNRTYITITIDVSPEDASWRLTGPVGFTTIDGAGDRFGANAIANCPVGTYTLHFNPMTDYITPADQTKTGQSGGTIAFTQVYPRVFMPMRSVPAGTFPMGQTHRGDDALYALADEVQHQVTLSAYQIGKFEVTAGQLCTVLNYANLKGYLRNSSGGLYTSGNVYGYGQLLFGFDGYEQIVYSNGLFTWKSRGGYPMENHPMNNVSWYGALAFCNWLSEKEGFTPAYNLKTWSVIFPFTKGYRLPTEAEWERAAAWDGTKHWIYAVTADTIDYQRCSYGGFNPLNLSPPWSCPVGWFNGKMVSPHGNIPTIDSPSPVGCYDMSGNIWEWCYDFYAPYPTTPVTNPIGPATGSQGHCLRGGDWGDSKGSQRTAYRDNIRSQPTRCTNYIGMRLARTP
ncbi:SUMF1/EgtB/PvdO family nonheme iron enzyme [bacterium]|nr:SUMF1/EgtB/PvdO family nonheme iron enzyme [bacterium]